MTTRTTATAWRGGVAQPGFVCDAPGCPEIPEAAYAVPSTDDCEAVLFVCAAHDAGGQLVSLDAFVLTPDEYESLLYLRRSLPGYERAEAMLAQRLTTLRLAAQLIRPLGLPVVESA